MRRVAGDVVHPARPAVDGHDARIARAGEPQVERSAAVAAGERDPDGVASEEERGARRVGVKDDAVIHLAPVRDDRERKAGARRGRVPDGVRLSRAAEAQRTNDRSDSRERSDARRPPVSGAPNRVRQAIAPGLRRPCSLGATLHRGSHPGQGR